MLKVLGSIPSTAETATKKTRPQNILLGIGVHSCNPNTQEAEAGGF
jgi:hypothetical protein